MLNLYSNQLRSLPPQIGNLVNLTQLGLNENMLEYLPQEVGNLTNLQILDLRYNRLEELPARLSNLVLLKRLFLRYNRLSHLPGMRCRLLLCVCPCLILIPSELTPTIIAACLRVIVIVIVIRIPSTNTNTDGLCNLTQLQLLSVRNNLLCSLPDGIGALSNLMVFDAYQNQLTSLPSLGGLVKLVDLNIEVPSIKPTKSNQSRERERESMRSGINNVYCWCSTINYPLFQVIFPSYNVCANFILATIRWKRSRSASAP